eukprot:317347-Chlamydomonas_euryale.AAC.1
MHARFKVAANGDVNSDLESERVRRPPPLPSFSTNVDGLTAPACTSFATPCRSAAVAAAAAACGRALRDERRPTPS